MNDIPAPAKHILPDSRLREKVGTLMVDWETPSGGTVRTEVEPVYCANCGKLYGHVPRENTAFAFWLCGKCYETYGAVAGTFAQPDEEFCRNVQYEMEQRFQRHLTDLELFRLQEKGQLGSALEKLARESPYPSAEKP